MLATIITALLMTHPVVPKTATPIPKFAGCIVHQVCQTCTSPQGNTYQCSCHMECIPGTH